MGCGDGEKAELSVEGGDEGRLPGTREGGSGLPDGCQAWPAHRAAMTVLFNGGCQIGGVECKQEEKVSPWTVSHPSPSVWEGQWPESFQKVLRPAAGGPGAWVIKSRDGPSLPAFVPHGRQECVRA